MDPGRDPTLPNPYGVVANLRCAPMQVSDSDTFGRVCGAPDRELPRDSDRDAWAEARRKIEAPGTSRVLIAHGADTFIAGFRSIHSGQVQRSFTQQGASVAATKLGASEQTAAGVGTPRQKAGSEPLCTGAES